jgi:hypothetical protein
MRLFAWSIEDLSIGQQEKSLAAQKRRLEGETVAKAKRSVKIHGQGPLCRTPAAPEIHRRRAASALKGAGVRRDQASSLRSGQSRLLDGEGIAEELDAMGASQRWELKSRLMILVAHLLKCE